MSLQYSLIFIIDTNTTDNHKICEDKILTILMFMKFGRKRKLDICFEVNKPQLSMILASYERKTIGFTQIIFI